MQNAKDQGKLRIKSAVFIVFFVVVALTCLAAIFFFRTRGDGDTVRVYEDGTLLYSVRLSDVAAPFTYAISEGNTAEISPDGARMIWADCPDQYCVHQGKIAGGLPIVCLPNRVMIRIERQEPREDLDGITGMGGERLCG
ncbi:MAG: NusG domain II-containing protein [Christensenellales bacterium]|jgi:hypothetical protein